MFTQEAFYIYDSFILMQLLSFENISKSYGEKTLFKDLNLTISKGQKIGLVAKNGSGKSTLLRVIAGEESAEGELAKIHISKHIKISFLKQDPHFLSGVNVFDAVFESDLPAIQAVKDYEKALLSNDPDQIQEEIIKMDQLKAWDIESKIKEVLGQLKITRLDQQVDSLSGGQKKRLALAKMIIDQPDFVIMDEPTNHLDLDMIEWLEKYLQRANLTIFMVTHDRYFLERICNEILELDRGKLFWYNGNYSDFLEKKAARYQNDLANLDKTKKLFKRELDWIRRQPKARTTKAKSRIDNFYEIEEAASVNLEQDNMTLTIESSRLGSKIIEAHAISKSYDDLVLVDSFSYKFKKGEKVGIAGPNGVGKSTFLKLLTKEIRPDGGKVVIGDTVVIGHYSQAGLILNEDKRVIDVVRDVAEYLPLPKGGKLTAESLLERFLFPRPQQQVFVSQLSGGEKRRLYLLTVLMDNPNFLILDEPTNDLDILTINVLEDYLASFKGCVMIVSHDRYFMDKIVDHLFVFEGNGKIKDFNGNYTKYRREQKEKKTQEYEARVKEKSIHSAKAKDHELPIELKRKLSYNEKREMQNIERELENMEKRKKEIHELFNDTSLDGDKITELSVELGEIQNRAEDIEMRWLELSEFL